MTLEDSILPRSNAEVFNEGVSGRVSASFWERIWDEYSCPWIFRENNASLKNCTSIGVSC